MNCIKKSNIKWLVTAFVLVTAIFLFIYSILPYSDDDIRCSVLNTEHRYTYVIEDDGKPVIYFDGITSNSLLINPTISHKEVTERSLGCWVNGIALIPSCRGRIATVFTRTDSCLLDTSFMRKILVDEIVNYDNTLSSLDHADIEIDYYIDTHCDKDEGFDDVLRYRDSLNVKRKGITNLLSALKRVYSSNHLSVKKNESFFALYRDKDNKEIRKECIYVPTHNEMDNFIIQTCDSITPDDVKSLNTWNIVPFSPKEMRDTVFVMGRMNINGISTDDYRIDIIPEYISGDTLKTFPRIDIVKGAPIFTRGGIFLGIIGGDTIISRKVIRKSM